MQIDHPRDPYGDALCAVRRFAETGRFTPGEAIVVTELAAEVGHSATPVREALARLSGEGLIERRRGRGYFYPALSAAEIIDLFELQMAYLHAALTIHPRGLGPLRKAATGVDPLDGAQALFDAIIDQSDNAALAIAHARAAHRLGSILRAERALDEEAGAAVKAMVEAIVTGRLDDLLTLLARFHEHRCARAHELRTDNR